MGNVLLLLKRLVVTLVYPPPRIKGGIDMQLSSPQRHNPDCKLLEYRTCLDGYYVALVFSVSNEGKYPALEVYHYKSPKHMEIGSFHRSYRYNLRDVPQKYTELTKELMKHIQKVPNGHKSLVAQFKLPHRV